MALKPICFVTKSQLMNYFFRPSCVVFVLALFFSNAQAQTVYVKSGATGAKTGTSWADAYASLSLAIAGAPAGASLWVSAGTYKPVAAASLDLTNFMVDKKLSIYGGFAGTESMLSQRNYVTNKTILSGDMVGDDVTNVFTTGRADNAYHVVFITAADALLDGIYIRGGTAVQATTAVPINNRGGGVIASQKCTIRNCTISDCAATAGGGISLNTTSSSGSLIENCIFESNLSNLQGSGLNMELLTGATVLRCTFQNSEGIRGALHIRTCNSVRVDSCAFNNNTGIGAPGGAYYELNSSVNLSNSLFTVNRGTNGGAVYTDHRDGVSLSTITNCKFEDNSSEAASGATRGGAIFNATSRIQIDDCFFKNNKAVTSGGAIHNTTSTNYNISRCLFEGNTAAFGAAAANYNTTLGTYNNCKFSGNTSVTSGGATSFAFLARGTINSCLFEKNNSGAGASVFLQNDTTAVTINDTKFVENKATGNGGAVAISGGCNLILNRSEFTGNTASTGGALSCGTTTLLKSPNITIDRSLFFLNAGETQAGALNISNGNVVLTSSVFASNSVTAAGAGGAISNNAGQGRESSVRLINCTLFGNSATIGAGVANWQEDSTASKATISSLNTIYENDGSNYEIEEGTPAVFSSGGNHSSDTTFTFVFKAVNDANGISPQMVDPSIEDFRLKSSSPCVNTAIVAGAPTFDFDGGARGNMPDKGAFELGSVGVYSPINQFEFAAQPNPTSGALRLEFSDKITGDAQLQVINALGQVVMQHDWNQAGGVELIDLQNLTSGVYQLRVQVAQKQSVKSIIKL
jgi:predicted outer membrane repeat protein